MGVLIDRITEKVKWFNGKEITRLRKATKDREPLRSVLFFNHHKCASTFANRLLTALSSRNLSHYNYSQYLERSVPGYNQRFDSHEEVFETYSDRLFVRRGELYGPLRKPFSFSGIEKYKAVFFLRDPRDSIISYYYSMGYSHKPPPVSGHRERFEQQRQRILNNNLDDYALGEGRDFFVGVYEGLLSLYEVFETQPLIVTYDLFKKDPKLFVHQVIEYMGCRYDRRALKLAEEASAINGRGVDDHVRDGASRQFEKELKLETIEALTGSFEPYLKFFRLGEYA